jgi:spore coat polysaccharide biosynthesis protein SpsF
MSRVVLVIQARMGSTRLPGKSMMPLAGRPLVARILERVTRCRRLDDIVLAIPDTPHDAVLGQLARAAGVKVYAGSESDLVERYYQAALGSKADIVGRLPADNATPEPAEIDRIADHHRSLGRRGFSSNLTTVHDNGYPDGIGAEMFDFSLLAEARERHTDPVQREHVHRNFFDYGPQLAVDADWCPISTIKCPIEFARPDLVLDVNTQAQYEFMRDLYDYLYPRNPQFHITDTIRWYDEVFLPTRRKTGAANG